MNAFDILEERGFFYQITAPEALRERLDREKLTFYVGFDPTADSLHVGHLLPVMAMRLLQQCGHRAIAVVGGGTAMVGDPSGKTEARPILSREEIARNSAAIKQQLSRFLDFSDDRALLLDNADWLAPLRYVDFLRDVGRHFSVNRMLAAESVKLRLETGLSFLEFNYMLLQSYDFYVLCRDRDCLLQLGGQDQWGNIVAGVDLVRRMLGREAYGATFPLLLKSDGEKFGKTAAGAVWLDRERTSPFDYYQFWRNAEDTQVGRLLAFFTPLPMDEVRRLGRLEPPTINRAKEILAFEATRLAHGEEEASRAYLAAGRQFGFADPDNRVPTASRIKDIGTGGAGDADLPTITVGRDELDRGLWIVELFVRAGLAKSNGEARRLIRGGGAYLNNERINDDRRQVGPDDFSDDEIQVRAGKKNVRRVLVD
ncbi:MAG: tyrosine--tRNA ligase [Kiritimatiellaeota bacterium]|nr:tyrosine--tRNA ligase [Kiritimatiellota bacterium]